MRGTISVDLNDWYIITFRLLIPTVFSMLFRLIVLGHKGQGRVTLGFGVFILYLLIISSILIDSIGYRNYSYIAALVMVVGSGAVVIFSSYGPAKSIFLHLLQANMVAAVLSLCNMMRCVLKLSRRMELLILLLVSILVLWLALRFWAKPLRSMVDAIRTNWETLIEISAIILVLAMILPVYPAQSFEFHPVYYTAIILGIELCFFLFLYVFYRNLRKIYELVEAAYQQKKWNNCVDTMRAELIAREEFLSTIRLIHHDLRYHNAQLMEYLVNRDMESAISYLRTYDSRISEPSLPHYCQNHIANSLLHRYVRMAREEDISCTIDTIIPEVLPYNEEELCVLLVNLLENACEACRKTEKGISRIITVAAKVEDIHLMLEIRNTAVKTVPFDKGGLPLPDGSGGGIGTRSVAELIKQHGDMVRFLQIHDIFTVQLMIQL
jgi:signal transduction histidine kinase